MFSILPGFSAVSKAKACKLYCDMSHKFKTKQEGKGMKRKVTSFKAFERINKHGQWYRKVNYKTFFCYGKHNVLITVSAGNTTQFSHIRNTCLTKPQETLKYRELRVDRGVGRGKMGDGH